MTLKYLNLTGLNALVSAIKTWVLSKIPTKTSELTNDANFITSNDLPTNHVTTDTTQTITSQKTWTGEQSFTLPIAGSITGTASKAIADEDGNNIKTTYGKLAGDQTWTGINVYSQNINIKASSDIPAGGYGAGVAFRDYQSNRLGYIQPHVTSDNNKTILFGADTGYLEFNSNLVPYASSAITLGASSYQWSSVYAQTYYYNGTQWGLDKENTWSQNQIIASGTNDKCYYVKDTVYELGQDYSNGEHLGGLTICDKNGSVVGMLDIVDRSYGNTEMRIRVQQKFDPDSNNRSTSGTTLFNEITLGILSNKANFVSFNADLIGATKNLGTSTNKWKTLNGVNPGALSLPDVSKSVTVDIPVDWVTDGSAWNTLNVSNMGEGWLCLTYRLCGANDYILARLGGTNANTYPSMLFPATLLGDSKYYIFAFLPVTKAMGNIRLEINLTSGSVVVNHSFYPCLGNV